MRLIIILSLLFTFLSGQPTPAYCTYHMYTSSTDLLGLTCSDGANGIIAWDYKDLNAMYPYVTAWQRVAWNSPQCGTCIKITSSTTSVYLTAVDQCGPSPKAGSDHFDISQDAFYELFGDQGISVGTMSAMFQIVDPSNCKGNKKKGGSSTSPKLSSAPAISASAPTPIKTSSPLPQPVASQTVQASPSVLKPMPVTSTANSAVSTPTIATPPITPTAINPPVNIPQPSVPKTVEVTIPVKQTPPPVSVKSQISSIKSNPRTSSTTIKKRRSIIVRQFY